MCGVYARKSYIIYAVFLSASFFVYTSLFQKRKLIQRKARERDEGRERESGGGEVFLAPLRLMIKFHKEGECQALPLPSLLPPSPRE